MTWGIKVSKIGFDVKTCNEEDLVMSSEINTLKTFTSANIPPNGTAITHNFGYIPIHLYAGYLSSKSTNIGFIGQTDSNLNDTNVVAGTSTITNNNNGAYAADALVYVFYDSL